MPRAQIQVAAKSAAGSACVNAVAPTYAAALKSAHMAVGAAVTDKSGRERLDLCNAEGAVILGWADARVENTVAATRPDPHCQAEAAERIGMLVPSAEAVAFRSHLNHALADALTAAKTVTGRDGAFFCDDDTTAGGDIEAISQALERHAGRVAALVIRPMEANREFLSGARRLTGRDGVVLIFDESRTALRVHKGGVQAMHGVTPDMTLLGPSIANGRPIAAIAGRVEPMRLLAASGDKVSGQALAATCATLDRVARDDVPERLTLRGAEIEAEIESCFARTGASTWFALHGDPTWSLVVARPRVGLDTEALEGALALALYDRNVLSFGAHVPSLAFNDAAIAALICAYDAALPAIVERAEAGEFERRLRRSALAQ